MLGEGTEVGIGHPAPMGASHVGTMWGSGPFCPWDKGLQIECGHVVRFACSCLSFLVVVYGSV